MAVITKTRVGKANIATRKSGHFCPGPAPAANLGPPTPPAGPVPAPFLYVAKTSSAHSGTLADETICKDATCLVATSAMDVERPGNMPTKPVETMGGADVVTHVVIGQARMLNGSARTNAKNGEKVCKTGDPVALNVPMPSSKLHQSEGVLILAVSAGASDAAKKRKLEEAKRKAAIVTKTGDPVAVVSGEVVEDVVDLAIPGMIPVRWSRHYRSLRKGVASALGRGGWRHGFEETLERGPRGWLLRQADGSEVPFGEVAANETAFERASRLELRRHGSGAFTVRSLDTRLTRELAPLREGGPAVLRAIRDAWGNHVELAWQDNRLERVVDTAARELRLLHDSHGRVARVEVWARGEMQQHLDYAYGPGGELCRVTNALGFSDSFLYDGAHLLVEKRLRGGLTVQYLYDDQERCIRSSTPEGIQRVALLYDTEASTTLAHENPLPVLYTYDDRGVVVRAETTDGGRWSEYDYDDDLYLVGTRHAGGRETRHEYDARGNRTLATDFLGRETRWQYDEDDRVVERAGPEGITRCAYDERGAMIRVQYPSGHTFVRVPDRYGRLVHFTGSQGRQVQLEHDAEHNVVTRTDERGGVTRSEHDGMGRLVSLRDPLGRVTRIDYDRCGRPVMERRLDGTVLRYEWDEGDHIVANADGAGSTQRARYGGTGSMVERTTADGASWRLQLDVLERVRSIQNPRGETFDVAYDRAGRVIEQKTFDGRLLTYQRSAVGGVARLEYPDESWVTYSRDLAGRLVGQASSDGTRNIAFTDAGLLASAVVADPDGVHAVENQYDEHHRIVSSLQGDLEVRFEYDAHGRRAARHLPGGHTTRYYWDASGELVGLAHGDSKILVQRDVMGRVQRYHAYDPGLDILLEYDAADCVAALSATTRNHGAAEPHFVARRRFDYAAHARLSMAHDTRWGSTTYAHDAAGRLLSARSARLEERYEYGPAGYLTAAARGGEPLEPWDIGLGNVLRGARGARFESDRRHRRTRIVDARGTTRLLWDAYDQLREVARPDGMRVRFRYDACGRRVEKIVQPPIGDPLALPPPTRSVRYLWDGDELCAEIDSERGIRVFAGIPGTFEPLIQVEANAVYYVVPNHNGTPGELVDAKGHVAWAALLSPWGELIETQREAPHATSTIASPFRMLGQYRDEDTGLCYVRYRWFDPSTMRWLTPDPLEMEGGSDAFGFNGSPTEHVDPNGLKSRTDVEDLFVRTDKAREEAHAAAQAEQDNIRAEINANPAISEERRPFVEAQHTSAASVPVDPHAGPAPAVGRNDPGGTGLHAEANIGPLDGTAVGAGRPHCANCVNHIMNNGGVTASPIRSSGDAAWDPPPATPPGSTPVQDPSW